MAESAAPLYRLTKKGVGWTWDISCEESFTSLCKTLSENPVTLSYPDWSKPFHLEVDASQDAIGAVLAQEDDKGKMRPISFSSSTLDHATKLQYWRKRSVGNCGCNASMEEVLAGRNSGYYMVRPQSIRMVTQAKKTQGENLPAGSWNWSQ